MSHVQRSVLVAHSAEKMYRLVDDVAEYPKFLPWCSGGNVEPVEHNKVLATVSIDFKGLRQSFTTVNTLEPFKQISLLLRQGPFTSMSGHWQFKPLTADACEVRFELHYAFAAGLLGPLLSPIFDAIVGSLIDAFVARADSLYGA
jgi:ribosome-associated toxin RatA of RatAB toxin-antitoxin module